MNTKTKNAVIVGIQLPKISTQELESSLQELTRLVTTLGYNVVGKVTQKRNTDRSASILGKGKLTELAEWTGGSGEIASMVDRKLTKAEVKRLDEESDDEVHDDEIEETGLLTEEQKGSAQIVIVDTDLSQTAHRNI